MGAMMFEKVWNQFFDCSGSGFHLRSKILAHFRCILIETKLFCFLNFFLWGTIVAVAAILDFPKIPFFYFRDP